MSSESPGIRSSDNAFLGCDTNRESGVSSRLDSFSNISAKSSSRHISVPFCSLFAVLVPFPELTFRLQPVVQVAAVNSAALDVDLEGSLTDFRWRRSTVLFLFCDVGLRYDLRHTLCIREKIA